MSTNKAALPFFARFLSQQVEEQPETTPPATPGSPSFPFPYTLKFPSDFEDF